VLTKPKPSIISPPPNPDTTTTSSITPQIKADLAEALRANGHLQTRVRAAEAELAELRVKTRNDTKRIEILEREKKELAMKVRDRDEEIKGKGRFLEVCLLFSPPLISSLCF